MQYSNYFNELISNSIKDKVLTKFEGATAGK